MDLSRRRRLRILALVLVGLSFTGSPLSANAVTVGATDATPGYSAKDVLLQSGDGLPDGVYWIDPDLPGGNPSLQVYADMTTAGGGWTLGHDLTGLRPDLDGLTFAINILAVNQTAQLRFVDSTVNAFYSGTWGATLPTTGWTVISGNASSLFGQTFFTALNSHSVFIRESETIAYPAAVPEPSSSVLALGGLIALLILRKRGSVDGRNHITMTTTIRRRHTC